MVQQAKSLRTLIPAAIGFVVVTAALIIGIQVIGVDRLRGAVESAGAFAPLVFIGIKILTYVIAPLTSGPLQLSAGVLFGLIPGTLYTLIGEVIGGSIAFWLSRRYGHPVVHRLVGDEGMARVDQFVSQIVDWKTLLYGRLFLFSIYDFISYAVGFSRLPFRTYLMISVFAGIIPTFIASLFGSLLAENQSDFLLIYGLLAVICIVPLIFQKRVRRWLKLDRAAVER